MAGTFHCSTPALGEVAYVQRLLPLLRLTHALALRSSALLNAGYRVSRSHASPGSLKTTAPRDVIHDVFRAWAERHPVRTDRISETAPAAKLLSKAIQYVVLFSLRFPYITHPFSLRLVLSPTSYPCLISSLPCCAHPTTRTPIDFTKHPDSVTRDDVRIVRHQQNPLPNWGPGGVTLKMACIWVSWARGCSP